MSESFADYDRLQADAFVTQSLNLPLTHLAFNSAVTSVTPTEILSVLSIGHRPLAMLIMSPVMAKTLALALLDRVMDYEQITETSVKTISEIMKNQEKLRAAQ